jgi:hypothetical protein
MPSLPPDLVFDEDEEPMEYDEELVEMMRKLRGPDYTPLPTTMKPKPAPIAVKPAGRSGL